MLVKTASRIIDRDLRSLESLYQQHLLGRASLISHDSSHPARDLFDPLPSSSQFRSIKTRTNRFNSSSPLAVHALSKQKCFFSHMCSLGYPDSVRWQLFSAPHLKTPVKSPDCILGEVTQPSDSRLSDTTICGAHIFHFQCVLVCIS